VKINPDHVQNEISLRLGQDLLLVKQSYKSMPNFLREAAQTDRQNDRMIDKRLDGITSAVAEVIKCTES